MSPTGMLPDRSHRHPHVCMGHQIRALSRTQLGETELPETPEECAFCSPYLLKSDAVDYEGRWLVAGGGHSLHWIAEPFEWRRVLLNQGREGVAACGLSSVSLRVPDELERGILLRCQSCCRRGSQASGFLVEDEVSRAAP